MQIKLCQEMSPDGQIVGYETLLCYGFSSRASVNILNAMSSLLNILYNFFLITCFQKGLQRIRSSVGIAIFQTAVNYALKELKKIQWL